MILRSLEMGLGGSGCSEAVSAAKMREGPLLWGLLQATSAHTHPSSAAVCKNARRH